MTRPHEPLAEAIRTARAIVEREGRALAEAAPGLDFDRTWDALALRIAQAIEEVDEAGHIVYQRDTDN